ncbi:energy-coupled thiamine transporter ThiT [Fundicoccus sp. Sow4_F4]|uniref:energy-coupled thiamine transporter ThiT n=1 Tax=Fundicoccus sp. Sow4_F4 TaxID=3438783 RepID=UPI003F9167F1
MNKRSIRVVIDMLIAIAIGVSAHQLLGMLLATFNGYIFPIILIPLIWLALRHGASTAIVAAAIAGLINGLIEFHFTEWINIILYDILPLLASGLAGFFAKYTQKTLNNRRLNSTYLNITTASLLVILGYFVLKFFIVPMGTGGLTELDIMGSGFWISFGITTILAAVILCTIAKTMPRWLIPARSKYLSRKETSSLLND